MIPDFNEHGYLPEGVHRAALEEIAGRFGRQSEVRRVRMESLRWLAEIVRKAGIERLLVNGSFVTDALEPNDVDCTTNIQHCEKVHDLSERFRLVVGSSHTKFHRVVLPG